MNKMTNNNEEFKLIIDTHILIWYVEGIRLTNQEVELIENARKLKTLYISAISVREITMLASKGKIVLNMMITEWIDKILNIPGLNIINLSVPILIQSCDLPNYLYKDPADRLIIASARFNNSYLMTHDHKIIDYGNQGYLKII